MPGPPELRPPTGCGGGRGCGRQGTRGRSPGRAPHLPAPPPPDAEAAAAASPRPRCAPGGGGMDSGKAGSHPLNVLRMSATGLEAVSDPKNPFSLAFSPSRSFTSFTQENTLGICFSIRRWLDSAQGFWPNYGFLREPVFTVCRFLSILFVSKGSYYEMKPESSLLAMKTY